MVRYRSNLSTPYDNRQLWGGKTKGKFFKQYSNSSAITASGIWTVGISESDKNNFKPFNALTIQNYSSTSITLRFDGSTEKVMKIPAGAIWERGDLTKNDVILFEMLQVINDSAVDEIPAEHIFINVERR